ncbi:hypothetical protein Acr_15g0002060 [Actinidia rufa]|uniref:Uncharacterized protein n=1 Tax=Actinidia rufa TaxID=165716 RepID=A0A7J0FT68_9ERIC|nr:hypothetical protein Acr_15g0002060 [Actinidia rufa]
MVGLVVRPQRSQGQKLHTPPPPPPAPAPVPPPAEKAGPPASPPAKAPAQVAPPNQGCVQPRYHHNDPYNMGVPMAYIDQVSQVRRVKNVELSHSRTFRMNFRDDPYECFHHHGHGLPPPPSPPCRYKPQAPPPRSCMHGPSPRPPPGPPPASRSPPEPSQCSAELSYGPSPPGYYSPPYYGGYFSDENPNGCILM